MLGIEERLQRKLRQAAAVGVGEVLPGFAGQDVNFTETREEIARLRREEASLFQEGNPSALSGEEYAARSNTSLPTRPGRPPGSTVRPRVQRAIRDNLTDKALSAQGKAESPYPGRPDPEIS